MAHVEMNPVFVGFSGQIGDLVFRRHNGGTKVARKPEILPRDPTERQKTMRERFQQGIQYGKTVMINPEARAVYAEAAARLHQPIYSVMISDFMNAPTVEQIDLTRYDGQAGSEIIIRAKDDFDVITVEVTIMGSDGEEIEKGPAVESAPDSGMWVYTATGSIPSGTLVRVQATAKDRPGHTGVKVDSRG